MYYIDESKGALLFFLHAAPQLLFLACVHKQFFLYSEN